MSDLAGVAIAVSSFRSDASVIALLGRLFDAGNPGFGAVIVVDSLGSGAVSAEIERRGWPVRYLNADRNLGSAGNLALRLGTAADLGLAWCYAVNHDGVVDVEDVRKLVRHGASGDRIGAVYPRITYENAGGRIEAPRRRFGLYAALEKGPDDDEAECVEVAWSSSNCALYNLDAVRAGAAVWDDLWMCWEDLAYGWELSRKGWRQLQCRDVTVIDNYEYRPIRLLGRTRYLAHKPNWYLYYQTRNLLTIARRSHGAAIRARTVYFRAMLDVVTTLLFRKGKAERLWLMLRGIPAAYRRETGKGPVP